MTDFQIMDHDYTSDYELECPVCGFNYNHLVRVEQWQHKFEGLVAELTFHGECGHAFILQFHTHKGMGIKTYRKIEHPEFPEENDKPIDVPPKS